MNANPQLFVLAALILISLALNLVISARLDTLMKRKPKRTTEEVLSGEERDKLKAAAAQQFEAAMVRELKRFEDSLAKTSQQLLDDLRKQVGQSDQQIAGVAAQLTQSVQTEYTQLLNQAQAHLKTQLATLDTQLQSYTTQQTTSLSALVESRKQAVITRVDTQLADILSNYLNATLEQLDLTDQEQFIVAKLEEMKPQLKEDLNHVQ